MTGTNATSYLQKNIDPAWTDDQLGIRMWTNPTYHRCYWATSATQDPEYNWSRNTTTTPDKAESYEVVATLTAAKAQKFFADKEGKTALTADKVNDLLARNVAHIWKNGMTYYFTYIRHLGTIGKQAAYGVVRNHVYDVTIAGVEGLGTPVFDPDQHIIPEKPDDEKAYIAATINILSWRIVPNYDITLGK